MDYNRPLLKAGKTPLSLVFLIVLVGLIMFIGDRYVLALEFTYPRIPGATAPQDFLSSAPPEQRLSLYALYLVNLIIWLAGLISLGALIYGGFLYVIFSGSPEKVSEAKGIINSTLVGITLLLTSYIILKVINPELITLKAPETKISLPQQNIQVISSEVESFNSSIDSEIPIGRVLEERIFASSTMNMIKKNATTTLELANKIKGYVENLNSKVGACGCYQTTSICRPCITKPPSTSDPCNSVRGEMQKIQQQNILVEIVNLNREQELLVNHTRVLREELTKAERIINYLPNECRLWTVQSLSEFLIKAEDFTAQQNGILRKIKLWEDVSSVRENDKTRDWATFYCPLGGTIFSTPSPPPALSEFPSSFPEEYTPTVKSCHQEAPVGDILNRSIKIGYKLIERLEDLLKELDKLNDAVSRMQILISQCSSRNCTSVCIDTEYGCIKLPPIGKPCPFESIISAVEEIKNIVNEVERIIMNNSSDETIGIVSLIDKKIYSVLQDWNNDVWTTLQKCVAKEKNNILFDTQRAVGATDPKGAVIRRACENEEPFVECQKQCYLQEDQNNYTTCLTSCLQQKANQLNIEEVSWCRNRLNFFCCGVVVEKIE